VIWGVPHFAARTIRIVLRTLQRNSRGAVQELPIGHRSVARKQLEASPKKGLEGNAMKALLGCTVVILMLSLSASAQESASSSSASVSERPAAAKPVASAESPDYKIGPQDVLRIDVWKEPEISRSVPVRPDGKVSLPLLNDVQAAGLTAEQLANTIRDGLTKFITSPQVTVIVTEINSRRVYCNGEVTKPGAMLLLPNMTVLQALSSCGGFTQFARVKNIYILRSEHGQQAQHPFNYKDVVKGKSPDVQLQPGDVIVVP
jgi:polysaccharide biosynthesis/export protein